MTRLDIHLLAVSAVALLATFNAAPASADAPFGLLAPPSGNGQARGGMRPLTLTPTLVAERQLSLREVAQIIAREMPGSILDAELTSQGGRSVYIVRWEPSGEASRGRIVIFVVDAESGRILARRGG